MRFKSYRVRSMAEAMARIAEDLGPNAVIVESRPLSRGLLGRFGRGGYEVTAAVDEGYSLQQEVAELRSSLRLLLEETMDDTSLLGRRLKEAGVAAEVVASLLSEAKERQDPDALRSRLEELLGAPQPILLSEARAKVVAFVGPTGVGKTTTLAKLAARFAIAEKVAVGLVSADSHRLAAAEQLRTYAEVLGVPMRVANNPREMAEAVRSFQDQDLVLVDTGGRSHQNALQLAELREVLAAARPDETHLVLSLSSDPETALRQAEAFRAVGVDKVLLTKRDEAERLGLVVNLAYKGYRPFSYVTTGQRVPEDIEPFSPRPVVRSLLGVRT